MITPAARLQSTIEQGGRSGLVIQVPCPRICYVTGYIQGRMVAATILSEGAGAGFDANDPLYRATYSC